VQSGDKIRPREAMTTWRQTAQAPVVFTNGVFDLFHAGHVHLLESAAALGGTLIVGINSDASVRRLGKGADRPIVPQADRARIVASLGCVDGVVLFDDDTPAALIGALQPDILVKGGDYRPETVVGADVVQARGGRVVIIPLLPDRSATRLLERLRAPS
jgi:rfaE bifunctional protein nucleotidyltransferase chain/domain